MANKERIQANNAELREAIAMAESLPDAGGETPADPILQSKTVTPTTSVQEVKADKGFDALEKVIVNAMPTAEQATPTITVSSNGLITAKATQGAGYVVGGTKQSTEQLPTQSAKTVVPTKSEQTVVESGKYTTGAVIVEPIPDDYIKPSGSLEVTENGTFDVTDKASVTVNVAGGSTEPAWKSEYQRVEYIESAEEGTYPYIITDWYADNDTGVEVVASFPVMHDRIPMGSREDSGQTRFYCVYPLSTSSCYYGFNLGSSISCSTKVNTKYRLQTNFMNSRHAIIYEENGTFKAFGHFTQTLVKHTVPISIFGYNSASSGSVTSKREYKLYSARLSHEFEIVREYIPCYRKSDGVVGVIEKFTGEFLTTPVGAFRAGPEIDWD